MALDPSIPLAVRPPAELDLVAALGRIYQLQGMKQEQQVRGLQIQQEQQRVNDLQSLDSAFQQPGGRDAVINALPGHLRPMVSQQFMALDKAHADYIEAQGKADAAQADMWGSAAAAVKAHGYDPIAAQGMISDLKQKFGNDPAQLQKLTAFEQALHANPTPEFVQANVDPLLAASPTQAKMANAITVAGVRAAPGMISANKPTEATLANDAATLGTPQETPTAARSKAALDSLRGAKAAAAPGSQADYVQRYAKEHGIDPANLTTAQISEALKGYKATDQGPGGGTAWDAEKFPNVPEGQKNEAYFAHLPANIQTQVKMLSDGRLYVPAFAVRTAYWQDLLQATGKYDPTFDTVNYNARNKTRMAFTSGREAQQINAINTVIGHLDSLSQATDALNNGNYPLLNSIANVVSKATGSPKVTNFDTIKKAVSDEVTRVWRQAGGSEQDIQQAQKNLDTAGSPAQLHGAIATYGDLLESKLASLNAQYKQGMGTDNINILTPKSRATLSRLEQKAGKASGSMTADLPTAMAPIQKPIPGIKGGVAESRDGGQTWTRVR